MGVSPQFIPLIAAVTAEKPLLNRRRLLKITLITHSDIPRMYPVQIYWIQACSIHEWNCARLIWADSMGFCDPSLTMLKSRFFHSFPFCRRDGSCKKKEFGYEASDRLCGAIYGGKCLPVAGFTQGRSGCCGQPWKWHMFWEWTCDGLCRLQVMRVLLKHQSSFKHKPGPLSVTLQAGACIFPPFQKLLDHVGKFLANHSHHYRFSIIPALCHVGHILLSKCP